MPSQRLLLIVFFSILLIAGGAVFFLQGSQEGAIEQVYPISGEDIPDMIPLSIHDAKIAVEIVDTPKKRQQGLSGRDDLAENKGMLFVYTEPETIGIWMKDMKFPIDILWFNAEKEVILCTSINDFENKSRVLLPALEKLSKNNIKLCLMTF